ncbi:hypothetical protein D9M72_566700 [compost metagenome]
MLHVVAVVTFAPKRLALLDVGAPCLTKEHILACGLFSAGLQGLALLGLHLPGVLALIHKHLEATGFRARTAQLPGACIADRDAQRLAKQARLENVGARAGRSDPQAEAGGLGVPMDSLLFAGFARQVFYPCSG